MSAIHLRDLSHGYHEGGRQHAVLDSLTASFNANEITALVGQSGSGKSTLLNLIGGLEPVQTGSIDVFDRSISSMDDRQRTLFRRSSIGIIYQSFNLIPTLTVAENIALPLALNKTPANERLSRIEHLLAATELTGRGDQYPDRLSGGEQQRVAIARAVVHAPPLILADEPTGNLDAKTGRRCLRLLTDLVREQACTLLLVTHSREVAAAADKLISLASGNLTVLDNPTGYNSNDPANSQSDNAAW